MLGKEIVMKKSIVVSYLSLASLYSLGMSFIAGTYSNFLRGAGLDELQVNLVNVAYFVVLTLFEIPTGIFADVFGRKKSFLISCFLLSISEFVYAGSSYFFGFVLAESLAAVAHTFASGAFQAWFVDRLKHFGYEENLTKIFGWEKALRSVVCIVGALIGGYVADTSMRLPWILGGIVFLIVGILSSIYMKEEYFSKNTFSLKKSWTLMKKTAKDSFIFAKNNKNFRFIIFAGMIQMFAVMCANMEWQKLFGDYLKKNVAIAGMMAPIQISVLVGGLFFSRWLLRKAKDEKLAILICQIIIGLGIILTVSFASLPLIVTFFLVHEVGRGMFGPIKDAYLHDNIPSVDRATLVSFESMYQHAGGALGLFASGCIAKYFGITPAWIVSGTLLVVLSLLLYKKR